MEVKQQEKYWDKQLNIHTMGRDDSHADEYRYPYEPTSYEVLDRLVKEGYLTSDSVLVDYGCGKGRVEFFLSFRSGCRVIGIEYDQTLLRVAQENQKSCKKVCHTEFICERAEEYKVDEEVDSFYFFHPFSVEILQKVLARIRESYYENPRCMTLFFYYPSNEYISYLMTVEEFTFLDDIDCRDLFDGKDERERILVFEINGNVVGFYEGESYKN
ncbi:MAG: class I SAM-dependent methyltransferase [Anaerostipes sp.]|nr:class I SAM-dependent methyltransferase [Anaerostipes sp.]